MPLHQETAGMGSIQSMFHQTACATIEQVGNNLLALDPEAQTKLAAFSDKTIHLHLTDFNLDYYFLFPGGSLVVQPNSQREPSASIAGPLSAFISAATAEKSGDSIFKGELSFTGEINTARQFQSFAQSLQLDWQETLSKHLGDVPAHHIAQGVSQLGGLLSSLFDNAKRDFPEFLKEEIQVTPPPIEVENFYSAIDTLRSQTDRLSARIERLKNS